MNRFTRYACVTSAYAVVRKVRQLRDAKLLGEYREDSKPVARPMLVTEKAGVMGASVLYSPILAPFWLFKDVNLLEIHLRKEDVKMYGYARADHMRFIEYILV